MDKEIVSKINIFNKTIIIYSDGTDETNINDEDDMFKLRNEFYKKEDK